LTLVPFEDGTWNPLPGPVRLDIIIVKEHRDGAFDDLIHCSNLQYDILWRGRLALGLSLIGVAFILDIWWGLPGFQVQKLTEIVKRLFRNIVVLSIAYLWPGR
jgi:hypothetical protein